MRYSTTENVSVQFYGGASRPTPIAIPKGTVCGSVKDGRGKECRYVVSPNKLIDGFQHELKYYYLFVPPEAFGLKEF